jgi:hypothetical protein
MVAHSLMLVFVAGWLAWQDVCHRVVDGRLLACLLGLVAVGWWVGWSPFSGVLGLVGFVVGSLARWPLADRLAAACAAGVSGTLAPVGVALIACWIGVWFRGGPRPWPVVTWLVLATVAVMVVQIVIGG